ncbi:16733_t:CDS:1, partial [Dentiscutata erythropus]
DLTANNYLVKGYTETLYKELTTAPTLILDPEDQSQELAIWKKIKCI